MDDDAVDERLLGEWVESSAEPSGWYSVARNESGGIEIRAIESDGRYVAMEGFTSQVGDFSFMNLQYVRAGCLDCSAAELVAWQQEFNDDYSTLTVSNPVNTCTWLIQYYYFDADGAVHFVIPDDEIVVDAIEAGELSGREGKNADSASEFDGICLTGARRQIRDFMADSSDALFLDVNDEVFVRRSTNRGIE